MIIDDIIKIKSGDSNLTLKLIEKFNPVLKKYAFNLYYEDAYHDLLVDFIELLLNINIERINNKEEGCLISYLTTSIHNSYIKKLIKAKQMQHITIYSDLTEQEVYYIEALTATNDKYVNTELNLLKSVLTNQEFLIVKMIFYEGCSVAEIADTNGITRQAINQMKNRALKKLKKIYIDTN